MANGYVVFLWHMHQPSYEDALTGKLLMPWTRLHAVKDYYDVPFLQSRFPGVKSVYNLTPSLMQSIQGYAEDRITDTFLEMTKVPAVELQTEQQQFILTHFFSANQDSMIKVSPRYRELQAKQQVYFSAGGGGRTWFDIQDLRDLQVHFNLAWCGWSLQRHPEIARLKQRDRGFTEQDKDLLLALQREHLGKIIPLYRTMEAEGMIEISTTPFHHPIAPLVCDIHAAQRSDPGIELPSLTFRWPQDIDAQTRAALDFVRNEITGKTPRGLWPAEGSISDAALGIFRDAGVAWAASDELVLRRSRYEVTGREFDPRVLTQPHAWGDGELALFFRQTELSNRIGFSYANWEPERAAEDIVRALHGILDAGRGQQPPPIATVALDGENAWEYYPGGGESFLAALFERLQDAEGMETTTFSNYLAAHAPKERLPAVVPGSWIFASFRTWIGHPEKNRLWTLLHSARQELQETSPAAVGQDAWHQAQVCMYRAECSDWLWWMGDDHYTFHKELFDRLFRHNLTRLYQLLGKEPPRALSEPISRVAPRQAMHTPPVRLISPRIDGVTGPYYAWVNAGHYCDLLGRSTMHDSEACIQSVDYGFDPERFYLRVRPAPNPHGHNFAGAAFELRIDLDDTPDSIALRVRWNDAARPEAALFFTRGGETREGAPHGFECAAVDVLELALPLRPFGIRPGLALQFHMLFETPRLPRHRYPLEGFIAATVPDARFEDNLWMV